MSTLKRILLLSLIAVAPVWADDLAPVTSRLVDLDKVVELRMVTPVNGVTVAGQPSAEALDVFAESGYTTVIDIRGEGENRGYDEAAELEALGMHYVQLPIEGPDAVNFENAARLGELIAEQDGPVLVHCGSGNRVGALLALGRKQEGASNEEALAFGKKSGLTSLEGLVKERLEAAESTTE